MNLADRFIKGDMHGIHYAASIFVAVLMAAYFGTTLYAFIHFHWWLPLAYPLGGAMLALHVVLLVHLVMFEEQDKRRVKSVFSKLVSPNIVNELLNADKLEFGGRSRLIQTVRGAGYALRG